MLFILSKPEARENAIKAVRNAPPMYRVKIEEPKRNLDQNARMWAMLGDISAQAKLHGMGYDSESWKCIFMTELGHEMDFLPRLNGQGFFPKGHRSSHLSKAQMSDLIAFMEAWGAQNGVKFQDAKGYQDDRR